MELNEIKRDFDKDYQNSEVTRENAADDLVFYYITQWDDNLLNSSDLSYRGEFNILKKAGREIMIDLRNNPVQPDFHPISETTEDDAELLDGLYRSDDRKNTTQEAYFNAQQEAVVCGVGAWELYTDYESLRNGDTKQVIKRMPIHEANNTVFWDCNSKLQDKSDANRCTVLTPYSKDGYEAFVTELTGEDDYKAAEANFKQPQYSYVFPWVSGTFDFIWVASHYRRKLVKDKVLTFLEPMAGSEVMYYESQLSEVEDELIETGHVIISEKAIERYEVTKYICSGERILWSGRVAGENIPVVPTYGERAIVEGQEHWEGITRLAKDPQRLHNFIMSYMADIASRSPRPKPIFYAESVRGLESMYEKSGADNNYPYTLVNRFDKNSNELPLQPAVLPEQPVPTAVTNLVGLSRQSMQDVAGNGGSIDITDTDLSGEALIQLEKRIKIQSFEYQENMKHAKRRDAEIYAGMVREVYDVPRKSYVTLPDGTRKEVSMMSTIIDSETGEAVVINDLTNAEFEVYADISPTYQSQKDQMRQELKEMLVTMQPDDPLRPMFQLKYSELIEGADSKELRDYARKQLILQGFKEPETEEEKQLVLQAQEAGQQPDANMVLAQAEMTKAQAALMREQREQQKDAASYEIDKTKVAIDTFDAQTKRLDVVSDIEQTQQKINIEKANAIGKQYTELLRGTAS